MLWVDWIMKPILLIQLFLHLASDWTQLPVGVQQI